MPRHLSVAVARLGYQPPERPGDEVSRSARYSLRGVPVGKSADDRPGSAFVHGTRSYRPGLVRAAKRCLPSNGAGSWP